MKPRTFRGKTMAETLAQVKRAFGSDAVILNTRTLAEGGLLGLGGAPYVEITAARQVPDLPPLRSPSRLEARSGDNGLADGAAEMVSPGTRIAGPQSSSTLLSEVAELKSLVRELLAESRGGKPPEARGVLADSYRELVQNTVAEEVASQLVERVRQELTREQLSDPEAVRAELARGIACMLPTSGPISVPRTGTPKVVALVGPTGVGKTTTVAKLAAHFCLREQRRVGLITIDTYRIAAVEQLKTYADIIDVALEVVISPAELRDAVGRLSDCDVIFLDTAGRSQRDGAKISELKSFFDAVRPDEVHLVLASNYAEGVLIDAVRRFRVLKPDRVIFTKLDEAVGFGVILACLQKAEARLSYVTTGQDVPHDIRVGEGAALAGLILSGASG